MGLHRWAFEWKKVVQQSFRVMRNDTVLTRMPFTRPAAALCPNPTAPLYQLWHSGYVK
jgi:hypothetical protein